MSIKKIMKKMKVNKMYRSAQFDQATIDQEARTVELSFSSEEPYERYFGWEILGHSANECRLDRLNNGGAFCMDHNSRDQVGVVEKAWIGQDRKGRALVRFGKSVRASEIFQDVIDGIRQNVSVGYDVFNMLLEKSETIDGGKNTIDTYRVTDWEPLEISLVAVPADTSVGVGRDKVENEHEIEITIPIKEEKKKMKKCNICGAEYEGDSCPVCARAKEAAERNAKEAADARAKEASKQEASRVNDILAMGRKHELMEEAQKFIAEQKSVQDFKDLVIDKISAKHVDFGSGENQAAKQPYKSLGDQLVDIAIAGKPEGSLQREKLVIASRAISGMSTSVPSDGGYLIQAQFTNALLDKPEEVSQISSRATKIPIGMGFDSLEAPFIEETSRATGSRWGGVQTYREGESLYPSGTKPKIGEFSIRLYDLISVCYANNRQLQNAPALETIITKAFRSENFFKLDDEVVRGTGAGQCIGITIAPGTVTVSKETGQKADTIITENINKMFNALLAASRGTACWFYNQECEPQLETLSLAIGTGGVLMPMFQYAGNGTNNSPVNKLKGLPAFPVEQASALGDLGDIILADMTKYILIDQGGIQARSSIEVKFLENEKTFQFIYRVNGAPMLKSAITPYKGAATYSHFVILQAR
jgi:HK97 family phage major capsid protein